MPDVSPAIPRSRPLFPRRYLGLVFYKAYAELRAESSRTYVGYLWWILEPMISMAVYYFVFQFVLRRGTEDFAMFLIVGLVPWRWFATGVLHGANSILGSRSLMQQVYLPKVVLPLVSLLTDTFKFAVVFVLLVAFVLAMGYPVGTPYLALPLVILVQGVFVGALTLLAAAVTPFLPDVRLILESLLRLWFFVSGIFHPLEGLSPETQLYLRLNPMTPIIESYRDVLLDGRWPQWDWLLGIGAVSLVLFVIGERLIRRFDFVYPKLSR